MKSNLISPVPGGSPTLSGLLWHPSPPWASLGGEGHQQCPLCLCSIEPGQAGRGPPSLGLPQEPPGLPGGLEHLGVKEAPSLHSATLSELCLALCWAGPGTQGG